MPIVTIKKVQGLPETVSVTVRGTKDKDMFEEKQTIARGEKTTVSDAVLTALKRSDEADNLIVEEAAAAPQKEGDNG